MGFKSLTFLLFNFYLAGIVFADSNTHLEESKCVQPIAQKSSRTVPTKSTANEKTLVLQTVNLCGQQSEGKSHSLEKIAEMSIKSAEKSATDAKEYGISTIEHIKSLLTYVGLALAAISGLLIWLGFKSWNDLWDKVDKKASEALEIASKSFIDQANQRLKTLEKHVDSETFFALFSLARLESAFVNRVKADEAFAGLSQLRLDAIAKYNQLLKDISTIDESEISRFIEEQGMKTEKWDIENTSIDSKTFLSSWMWQDLGFHLKRSENLAGAIISARSALRYDPDNWGIQYNLACYLCLNHETHKAETILLACLDSKYGQDIAEWITKDKDVDFRNLRSSTLLERKMRTFNQSFGD